jgi:hypothetical protein
MIVVILNAVRAFDLCVRDASPGQLSCQVGAIVAPTLIFL